MSPGEKNIVRSLIAVAWADGRMHSAESSVIDGLLCGFDASPEEEQELTAYASSPRTLEEDIPLAELSPDERELLFANAVLLMRADGHSLPAEQRVLVSLARLLELSPPLVAEILNGVRSTSSRPPRKPS